MLKSLYGQLVPLITERKPVSVKVPDEVNTTWVRPKLVAEFKFAEWTSKGGNATAGFSRVAHRQASQRCGEGDAAITIVVLAKIRLPPGRRRPPVLSFWLAGNIIGIGSRGEQFCSAEAAAPVTLR